MIHETGAVGISEAARILGWSKDTLRRWANAGVFPHDAVELSPGGHRRFRVEVIREWARSRASKLTSSGNREKLQRIFERHSANGRDSSEVKTL